MSGLNDKELFMALEDASENVYIFENDMTSGISKWSDHAVRYFGLPEEYAVNTLEVWIEHIHPDDRAAYLDDIDQVFSGKKKKHYAQYRARNAEGEYVWVECVGNVIFDHMGKPSFFAGMITRLDQQSKYDPITKCLSLNQFYQLELDNPCIMILLGMDGFRKVVNTFGYSAGNDLLVALVEVIRKTKENLELYRMTGDEILIILSDRTEEEAKSFFEKILNDFQEKTIEMGYWLRISFSGGAIRYAPDELEKDTAIRQLEHSLQSAKEKGTGCFAAYSRELEEEHRRIQSIKRALRRAIRHDFEGFELYYQPIMDSRGRKQNMVEALLRFQSPEQGMISPVEFIPLLEESGDIKQVGFWVMETAVRQQKAWQEQYSNVVMSFNVSYLQLYDYELVDGLIDTVERYEVCPNNIIVELTESCKVEHPQFLAGMMEKMIKHGFRIALDDFGIENSTFALVRDLPITEIKVDHSFVRKLFDQDDRTNRVNRSIVSCIIELSKQIGADVVVEGVETEEIAKLIMEKGADYLQGYYYSRPVPADEVEKLFS